MRSLALDVFSAGAINATGVLMSLATVPFLARTLDAEGFGLLSLAMSAAAVAAVLAEFGTSLRGTREAARLAERPEALGALIGRLTALRVAAGLLAAALPLLAALLVPALAPARGAMAIAGLYVLGQSLLPAWLLQARGRFGTLAWAWAGARALALAGLLATVAGPEHVTRAVAWQAAVPLLALLLLLPAIARELHGLRPASPAADAVLAEARGCAPIAGLTLAHQAATTGTVAILGLLLPPAALAHFSLAERILSVVHLGCNALTTALYPQRSRLAATDPQALVRANRRLLGLTLPAGALAALALFVFAEPILAAAGGDTFVAAAPVLRALAPFALLVPLSEALAGLTLMPLGMERTLNRLTLAGAALMIGAIAPACWLGGEVGAALLRIAHDAMLVIAMGWSLRRAGLLGASAAGWPASAPRRGASS